MAHDNPHGQGHGNAHVHGHERQHGHSHGHGHGGGHNHDPAGHLHSHMAPEDEAVDLQILCTQFIEGFREASDKAAYLRLAGVPLELPDGEGRAPLKFVDVRIISEWQVGTASPSFGSRELSYMPFPGEMVTERTNMAFLYVSLDRTEETDLRAFLQERLLPENARS